MSSTEESEWEAYFYPDTDVLRNKFGYTEPADLAIAERYASAVRQSEIESGEMAVPRTYDADHLRAIHRHLFQDVYDWAGQDRTILMGKPGGEAFAPPAGIDFYLSAAAGFVARTDWPSLDQQQTAHWAGAAYAWVNQAHPFREGNGRAGKIWLAHVVEQSPWRLDLSMISRADWTAASAASSPRAGQIEPDSWPLSQLLTSHGAIVAAREEEQDDAPRAQAPAVGQQAANLSGRLAELRRELGITSEDQPTECGAPVDLATRLRGLKRDIAGRPAVRDAEPGAARNSPDAYGRTPGTGPSVG